MQVFFVSFFLAVSLLAAPLQTAAADEQAAERARRILAEVDDMWRGESSHLVFKMQVKTAHYTRTMRMEGWTKGKEKSLVRITYPLKERGTATLKSGKNIYTYLPKTGRTIRITSGMMMGSWMGSHFTNDDLVKESRMGEDYNPEITFEGIRDGQEVLEFTLMPKPDAAVVWGKVVIVVRKKDHIPLYERDYDEDFQVVRDIVFEKIKTLGGRKLATVLRVTPRDKPDEFTEIVYEKARFGVKLDDSFFSIARLQRR